MTRGSVDEALPAAGVAAQPSSADRKEGGDRGRFVRWLPAVAVLVWLVGVLLLNGTPAIDIVRYAGYVGWALLLPGTLVYRALRRNPHSLPDDLAMGAVIGFALEIAAYLVFSGLGLRGWLWAWPLVVVLVFVAAPRLRRHWRRPDVAPVPLAWSWTVAGAVIAILTYLGVAFMGPNPLPPGASKGNVPDLYYMLSLIAEAKHHFPLKVPQLGTETLAYHWFTYAHEATASLISGVDTPIVFLRLALPVMCIVSVVLLAVVGWRVSGKAWVGALAAALMFVVGEFSVSSTGVPPFGTAVMFIVWSSHSMTYSWLFGFALLVVIVDRLHTGTREGWAADRRGWVLLTILALAAAGAKPTVLSVILAGLGLVGLVELIRRRRLPWAAVAAFAVILLVQVAMAALLTKPDSYGLFLSPAHDFRPFLESQIPRPWWKDIGVAAVVAAVFAVTQLPRFAGIAVFGRYRTGWGQTETFLLGGIVSGLAGTLLFGHQSYGQQYFLKSGFVFGAILSAMGFVALVEKHRIPPRRVAAITAVLFALGVGLAALLWWYPPVPDPTGYRALLPVVKVAAALAGVAAVAAIGWRVVSASRPQLRGVGAVTALMAVLLVGTPGFVLESRKYVDSPIGAGYAPPVINEHHVAAGRWVREHTAPEQMLATNDHRLGPRDAQGWGLSFWLQAYSERRTLLGSWAYAPWVIAEATRQNVFFATVPYQDQQLFAFNESVFYQPNAALVARMRDEFGVRWLVVDRDEGMESAELARFATLRHTEGPIAIYEIGVG